MQAEMFWFLFIGIGSAVVHRIGSITTDQPFQFVAADGLCLQVQSKTGYFTSCTSRSLNGTLTPFTVYQAAGGPGSTSIHIVGSSGLCLDRQHCHHSTSELRYSGCDHCGAIHWSINADGMVAEDKNQNCIFRKDKEGSIHHCGDGFEKLSQKYINQHEKDLYMKNFNDYKLIV